MDARPIKLWNRKTTAIYIYECQAYRLGRETVIQRVLSLKEVGEEEEIITA